MPFHPYLHRQGRLVRGGVPADLRGRDCSSRRTISAIRTITSRPTRWRRRRTSCPNGISGRSTRSCARSRSDFILPAKLWGVLAMFGSILLLFFLPWLDKSPVRSGNYRPLFKRFFWLLVIDVLILGYVGGAPPNRSTDRARPDRGGLLFPALPDHPAAGLGVRDAAAAAQFDHRQRACTARRWRRPGGAATRAADPWRRPAKGAQGHMRIHSWLDRRGLRRSPVVVAVQQSGRPISAARRRRSRRTSSTRSPRSSRWRATGRSASSTRPQLQRGFQVYSEVCSACHASSSSRSAT